MLNLIRLKREYFVLFCFCFLFMNKVYASSNQTGDSVEVKFSGKLQAITPCEINKGHPISVFFGNVGVNKVDSGQYIKELQYSLDCGNATSNNTFSMYFTTVNPVATEPSSIQSDIAGLWVKILKDGTPLEMGKEFQVADPLSPPKIDLLLTKDPVVTLIEGDFSATGTLVAVYK